MLDFFKENNPKFWIVDVSFYIYNGTYAQRRACTCIENKKKADPECPTCSGKGQDFLRSDDGIVTGGIYTIFKSIIPRIDEGFTIILVFDPPKEQLDRSSVVSDYKGNRPETPDFIKNQMKLCRELFPYTDKIICYTSDTDESDDVMATLAIKLAAKGYEVVVASDDKDMFPLLGYDNIKLFRQKELFAKEDFAKYMMKKYKIKFSDPSRFSEFLAIIGDAADNYNIIKGLGPKAAEYFLNTFDSILEIWDNWDKVPSKYQKKLVKYDDNGKIVGKLKDELNTSLQLAFLNLESNYRQIKHETNKKIVFSTLEELNLRSALYHINKFFK